MSVAYARSGGSVRKRGPSGRASAAMASVVRTTTAPSTRTFTSTSSRGVAPMKIWSGVGGATFSRPESTTAMRPKRRSGAGSMRGFQLERPERMPSPIPRKLAMRMKLLKKPT